MFNPKEIEIEEIHLPSGVKKAGVRLENGLIVALNPEHLNRKKPKLEEYEVLSIQSLNTNEGFTRVLKALEKNEGLTLPIKREKLSRKVNWYAWASVIATDTETFVNLHYLQI